MPAREIKPYSADWRAAISADAFVLVRAESKLKRLAAAAALPSIVILNHHPFCWLFLPFSCGLCRGAVSSFENLGPVAARWRPPFVAVRLGQPTQPNHAAPMALFFLIWQLASTCSRLKLKTMC